MLFLAIVNSIIGLVLLSLLVLRGGSGAAASLFFLSPPVTAVLAWLVLDETLPTRQSSGWWSRWSAWAPATRSPAQAVGTQ